MTEAKGRRFRIFTLAGASLLIVLSLPLLYASGSIVRTWLQFHSVPFKGFYVEDWLDATIVILSLASPVCLLFALVGFLTALRPSWPKWRALAVPLGIVLALIAMVWIPNVPIWYPEFAQNVNHLSSLERLLDSWYRIHDRYPVTPGELQVAIPQRDGMSPSPYAQTGKRLNYEIQLEANQAQPFQVQPGRPGIVYYAVSENGEQFWLTVSGLNAPFAERPSMARTTPFDASKQPWQDLLVVSDHIIRIRQNQD